MSTERLTDEQVAEALDEARHGLANWVTLDALLQVSADLSAALAKVALCEGTNPYAGGSTEWGSAAMLSGLRGQRDRALADLSEAKRDDPELDCTDAAHPAWWRGQEYGADAIIREVRAILDGTHDASGACSEPWESVRRRLLALTADLSEAREEIGGLEWTLAQERQVTHYTAWKIAEAKLSAIQQELAEAWEAAPTDQQRQTIAYYLWPEAPGAWADVAVAAKRLRENRDEAIRKLSALQDAARAVCDDIEAPMSGRPAPPENEKMFMFERFRSLRSLLETKP